MEVAKIIVILEPSFDFIISPNGKLFLVIFARPDIVINPFMVYDKKKTLALFRDKKEIIKLTEIPKKALKHIKTINKITVIEMDEDNNKIHQYTTKLIKDSQLKKKLKKEDKFIC